MTASDPRRNNVSHHTAGQRVGAQQGRGVSTAGLKGRGHTSWFMIAKKHSTQSLASLQGHAAMRMQSAPRASAIVKPRQTHWL